MDCVIRLDREKKMVKWVASQILLGRDLCGETLDKQLIICFAGNAVNCSIMADYSPSNENTTCQGNYVLDFDLK